MKKKLILIICLLLGICSIFIGTFAYYKIVVNSNINASIGNVVFNLKDSNNNELNNKTISLNNGNEIFPGDSGSFTITLDSSGSSVDLYSTLIVERKNLPTNLKFYTTSDHRSELHKYYSFLEKNKTNKETLTIYWYWNPYIDDIEDSKFINKSNLEATINVDAVQINKYATMKNGYSYDENMNGGTEFWNNDYKSYIRTIVFDNDLSNLPSSCTEDNLCFDITEDGSYEKVYGYLVDGGLKDNDDNIKSLYNLYIVSKSLIFAPTNCSDLFSNYYNLISIDFNNNFNTSNVTNMFAMFYRCRKLENLDLSSFNTSNVVNMRSLINECMLLKGMNLNNFNTKNVIQLERMFYNCVSLVNVDLSSFNTQKNTNMEHMFAYCKSLETLDLSSFDTSNVTNMEGLFMYNTSLKYVNLLNINTKSVTDMEGMFNKCCFLKILDLSSFNTSNVINMSYMFSNCTSLVNLDLSSFNTSNVMNMNYMFSDCNSLSTKITIMNSNITNYTNIFTGSSINENSEIVINYIADTSTIVDNMILTKSSNSNIIKGKKI